MMRNFLAVCFVVMAAHGPATADTTPLMDMQRNLGNDKVSCPTMTLAKLASPTADISGKVKSLPFDVGACNTNRKYEIFENRTGCQVTGVKRYK